MGQQPSEEAPSAKSFLNEFTVKPFMVLEKELGGNKYTESQGGGLASIGAGDINVATQIVNGVPLQEYLWQQIGLLPKNQLGQTDPAILARFIQNIPDNFKIGTEKFKTQLENAAKMEALQFKLS